MAAVNERADEMAKEGARDDVFQSTLCDTYLQAVETCKAIIGILARPHVLRCSGRQWFCKIKTGAHRMCWASCDSTGTARKTTLSPLGTDWQLCVVLQMWSESSQVREETWRTVCWASEVSGVRTKHPLAVEWLASQRESISWITAAVHEASMGEVAAKLPRGQLRQGWDNGAQASSNTAPHGRCAADESR